VDELSSHLLLIHISLNILNGVFQSPESLGWFTTWPKASI
jgi:hypothetical protein